MRNKKKQGWIYLRGVYENKCANQPYQYKCTMMFWITNEV